MFNLYFPNKQQIFVLTIGYSMKFTVNIFSFGFNPLLATCNATKHSGVASVF
jgi:hypothetical protein